MRLSRGLVISLIGGSALVACAPSTPPPPPVMAPPAAFIPLGLSSAYVSGDVVSGRRARAAKMRAAGIRPLPAAEAPVYMAATDAQLRQQTAGIGLDVLQLSDGILIRIPATLTFAQGSADVRPEFGATLLEIARTVKNRNRTYVDVFAHTDTTGAAPFNQSLSDRRAAAVAAALTRNGVARARIASRGYGETSPLYAADVMEEQRAANRRVEIRLVPYRTTDSGGRR